MSDEIQLQEAAAVGRNAPGELDEKRAQEQELQGGVALLNGVIDQSPFPMWIADPAGLVIRTNDALRETLGLRNAQIVGKYNVFRDQNLEREGVMEQVRSVFERQETARFDVWWKIDYAGDVKFEGGRDLYLNATIFPIIDDNGNLTSVVCQWIDVTEHKRAMEALEELSENLESRVKERTSQLEEANRELEKFAYSVSHDLRAPLRAITGFAQIIATRHREHLNEQGQHYFDNIIKASLQMSGVIEDLLTYSRLGRSKVASTPIDLNLVFESCCAELSHRIRELDATIEIAPDLPHVIGTKSLIEQIFLNLLDNALKYRCQKEKAMVRVSWSDHDPKVVIHVADNGIGIDGKFHGKIFDIFQRLHSAAEYEGTGVGLAIVSRAARLLGGRVSIDSVLGEGATFHVELNKSRGQDGARQR